MRLISATARPKEVAWNPVQSSDPSRPSKSRPLSKSQPDTVSASSGMLSEGPSTACIIARFSKKSRQIKCH